MRPGTRALVLATALISDHFGNAVAQTPPLQGPTEPTTHEMECKLAVTNDMRLNQKLETLHITVSPPTAAVLKDFSQGFEGYTDLLMLIAATEVTGQSVDHVYLCGAIRDPNGKLHRSEKFLYRQASPKR